MTRNQVKGRRVQRSKVRYPATERELHILMYTQDSDGDSNSNNGNSSTTKDTRKGSNKWIKDR